MRRPHPESQGHGQPYTFAAPARGWVETDSPVLAKSAGASVLENFLPTMNGNRLRGGCQALIDAGSPIRAMFGYDNGVTRKLFAVTENTIWDVSALTMKPPVAAVASYAGGEPVAVQFTTLGDTFLYVVNGTDDPQIFNGATWQRVAAGTAPIAITGTGSDKLSHAWVFKSRIFFVAANSMKVWALPVGQVGGAAVDVNLAGVFQKGGRVLFGTTWSGDSGAGYGDRCVIVTDRGEVAIFEGSDPADPNNWRIVGRYEIAPPLGVNAHIKIGGDVLIATAQGMVPLSGVVTKDPMALESIAVSRPISRSWNREAASAGNGWKVVKWDNAGVLLVILPGVRSEVWGAYAQTGAWFKITGWDMDAAAMHNGRLYFGGSDGLVKMADATGRDDGVPFTGRFRGLLEQAPRPGFKTVQLARAWFNTSADVRCSLRFVTRESQEFGVPPRPWTPLDVTGQWDRGLWDQMRWDAGSETTRLADTAWRAIGVSGQTIAPEVQVVSDNELPVMCELVAIDAIIEGGGVVV